MNLEKRDLVNKTHFIFDLDDTLIDSKYSKVQGIYSVIKNLCSSNMNFYQQIIDEIDFFNFDKNVREFIWNQYSLNVEEAEKYYWSGVGESIFIDDDVLPFLEFLVLNDKKIFILTNGGEVQHTKINLLLKGFEKSFIKFEDLMVTGDYGKEKYKPNTFCLNLLIKNNDKKECVYIGDSLKLDRKMCIDASVDFVCIDRRNRYPLYSDFKIKSFKDLMDIF